MHTCTAIIIYEKIFVIVTLIIINMELVFYTYSYLDNYQFQIFLVSHSDDDQ